LIREPTPIINTLKILEEGEDSFDLPYAIRRGYYYRVDSLKKGEAKPTIIWLRDYNGDGKALEFAFFDAVACMGLQTTLIGYSAKQDRVIQYPIELKVIEGKKRFVANIALGRLPVQSKAATARLIGSTKLIIAAARAL
jgi:hypothetical protein